MKRILLLLTFMLVLFPGLAQIKRIAILETIDKENSVPYAIEVMVRSNLTKVISNTAGYEGYDRVNISEIMDEHDFERTGLVNEDQIRRLGEISGADFILVSEAVKFDESNVFITAKILNVESAKTESSENALMGMTAQDIQHGCESLANRLLGIPDPYAQSSNTQQTKKQDNNRRNTKNTTQDQPNEVVTSIVHDNVVSKVGEIKYFPDGTKGMVFYLDNEGKGLAVSLEESTEYWDKNRRSHDIGMLDNQEKSDTAMHYGLGRNATQIIINALGSDAHAASWCRALGPEWYLPSVGELYYMIKVFNRNPAAAELLKKNGGGKIDDWYWSSTENDDDEAWNISSGGWISTEGKKTKVNVRAIRTFNN